MYPWVCGPGLDGGVKQYEAGGDSTPSRVSEALPFVCCGFGLRATGIRLYLPGAERTQSQARMLAAALGLGG